MTFKTQVAIFVPSFITFEMKTVKEVEELLGIIKPGRSTPNGELYMRNLKFKLTGDADRQGNLGWDSLMHSANVY